MNIAVLGTGNVGQTIGTALVRAGHAVRMGSRTAESPQGLAWASAAGRGAVLRTFSEAARGSDIVFNCTLGQASLSALQQARAGDWGDAILIDLANPLDFSHGMPPSLTVCNTDSLGEQIQRAFPRLKVVKALNTMNAQVMVDPSRVPGDHHVFLSGNDAEAKVTVSRLLTQAFGWPSGSVIDLGDITTARGTEMVLPIWVRLWAVLGTADFNFHIAGAMTHGSDDVPISAPVHA